MVRFCDIHCTPASAEARPSDTKRFMQQRGYNLYTRTSCHARYYQMIRRSSDFISNVHATSKFNTSSWHAKSCLSASSQGERIYFQCIWSIFICGKYLKAESQDISRLESSAFLAKSHIKVRPVSRHLLQKSCLQSFWKKDTKEMHNLSQAAAVCECSF